jgi:hypothetical protein
MGKQGSNGDTAYGRYAPKQSCLFAPQRRATDRFLPPSPEPILVTDKFLLSVIRRLRAGRVLDSTATPRADKYKDETIARNLPLERYFIPLGSAVSGRDPAEIMRPVSRLLFIVSKLRRAGRLAVAPDKPPSLNTALRLAFFKADVQGRVWSAVDTRA